MLRAAQPHPDLIHIYSSQQQQEDLCSQIIKQRGSKEKEKRDKEKGRGRIINLPWVSTDREAREAQRAEGSSKLANLRAL